MCIANSFVAVEIVTSKAQLVHCTSLSQLSRVYLTPYACTGMIICVFHMLIGIACIMGTSQRSIRNLLSLQGYPGADSVALLCAPPPHFPR